MDERSEGDLADQIAGEILSGVDGTDIRAGIIGEIGCSWPLTANERKVLRAAAAAQRRTGSAVLIHPGRNQDAPKEVLDVLAEAGADLGRVIMGHLDRTVADLDALLAIAARGCYLEYDLFGLESSYYPLSDLDMPNDAQRLHFIRGLVSEGYADRVVVGHDIYSKHRLTSYGGHGYAHFLENVAPRMEKKGFRPGAYRRYHEPATRRVSWRSLRLLTNARALAASLCRREKETVVNRPNLVFVFSDRQRFDTLACYGNDWIQTPNLNALAEESFVFQHCYVTQPSARRRGHRS